MPCGYPSLVTMESPFQGVPPHQPGYPGGLILPPNAEQEGHTDAGPLPPQHKDISISIVCRMGQETVQDIITKATEMFQMLKNLQPPNGTAAHINTQEERKVKVQEYLRTITFCFTKLRRICEKCNYSSSTMEYTHIEVDSLVPLKDETDARQDDRKTTDAVRAYSAEYNALVERSFIRNRQLKEIIDQLRTFIWDINTMLSMRKQ
ncbi:hypothetical protein JTE90_025752 [Oedothorax gibbosus]|uniref:Mediator of RNA polymerase II transcription subunit 30 n=1 Tax=Oedothorax gibbosus TaxID=931172 RepID=A0AAV6U6K1_9ARAC|nr:hypothetical protein JTE90_025752 [Oedothorax gibbosus]